MLQQLVADLPGCPLDRIAHHEGRAARGRLIVVGRGIGIRIGGVDLIQVEAQRTGGDLREDRIGSLADIDRAVLTVTVPSSFRWTAAPALKRAQVWPSAAMPTPRRLPGLDARRLWRFRQSLASPTLSRHCFRLGTATDLPPSQASPFIQCIPEPQFQGVHPQHFGQLVQLRLAGKGCLGVAEPRMAPARNRFVYTDQERTRMSE